MADREPVDVTNLDRYGAATLPWSRPHDLLTAGPLGADVPCFLGTSTPDGRPHAAGIGVVWYDGDLYFTSGPGTRKSREIAANPACTVSMRLPGIDLVLEGEAARVGRRADAARSGRGDAIVAPFSAPSAGPPPWHLHRFVFSSAVGVSTAEPFGGTRWRFDR